MTEGLSPLPQEITAVILAGGRGHRMGGLDKGLLPLAGKPLIAYIIEALIPQVGCLMISANRHLEYYQSWGYPVISDTLTDYQGPLAGMAQALLCCETPYLLVVPGDAPIVVKTLIFRLAQGFSQAGTELTVAHDGIRLQPLWALLPKTLLPSLNDYLAQGQRRVTDWYQRHRFTSVDFSDVSSAFINANTPAQWQTLEKQLVQSLSKG